MTIRPFDFLRTHLRQTVGIAIDPDKLHAFEHRLAPIAQARGAASVAALIESYAIHRDPGLWREIIEPAGGDPLDLQALAAEHARTVLAGMRALPSEPAP